MRGYYFHGSKRMIDSEDWRKEKARTLCVFSNLITDLVLHELTSDIYKHDSWKQYEECARSQGMVTKLELNAQLWCTLRKRTGGTLHHDEAIGDANSSRNRTKWALSALDSMKYDEGQLKLEQLVGKNRDSGEVLFEIGITRLWTANLDEGESRTIDLGGLDRTYIVKYDFSEREEEEEEEEDGDGEREYRFSSMEIKESPWMNDGMAKWLVSDALRASLDYARQGLCGITCTEKESGKLLFKVTLGVGNKMVEGQQER